MGIRRLWRAADFATRGFFICLFLLGGIFAWAGIVGAIEQYRFNRLPSAEQERIKEQRRLADAERTREAREQTRLAREQAKLAHEAARQAEEAEADRVALTMELKRRLEQHKANVEACVEAAVKFLPGVWPSGDAKARIEADCAMREARSERAGQDPGSN